MRQDKKSRRNAMNAGRATAEAKLGKSKGKK
jgi:hypothetical protein